jgi:hypothetical protein
LPEKGVCTPQGWCWAAPTPLGNSLESVWGAGTSDVWFAGHVGTGTIAHWDGTAVRGLTGLISEWGNLVTGTAADDVWVLGGPHALHYDGQDFTRTASGTDKRLRAAHAVTKTLAFAVGDGGTVVKWDGSTWAPFASGTIDDLGAVWAFAADDVWIAGTNAYHWNGTGWTSGGACVAFWGDTPSDFFCVRGGVALAKWQGGKWVDVGPINVSPIRGMWGTGPKDVVVLARDVTYHYDGTAFAVAASRGGISYTDGAAHTAGLWGGSASAYWAVGPRIAGAPADDGGTSATGSLFRYEGSAWAPFGENLAPGGLACTRQGAAFVGSGVAWTAYSDPSAGNKLARWNGSTYTEFDPGTDKPLLTIGARSAIDVWVTAEGGDVTHWDGTSWMPGNVGADVRLTSLYAAASTSVWVGGEAGRIFEFDGMKWVDRSVQMDSLAQLFGVAAGDVWAIGDKTYHYTKSWDAVDVPNDWPRLVAIWGDKSADLRAVALSLDSPTMCSTACDPACKGAVLAWDGQAWSVASDGAPVCGDTSRPVFTSYYSAGKDFWGTDGSSVYHFDDVRWTKEALPSDPGDLACGVAGDGKELLVAGPYPILRQKGP